MTFNYDRLFEIAFLDRFKIEPYGLYDVRVLNSGVTLVGINIEFEPEAFSFLKLHGSVHGWAIDFLGLGHPKHQRIHFESPAKPRSGESAIINDDFSFSLSPLTGEIQTV